MLEVYLGPVLEKGQPVPSAVALKRMGAYYQPGRFLVEKPGFDFEVPAVIFPTWCLCLVKGQLIKQYAMPDGTLDEQPICNARVHICEVDRIPIVLERIPDDHIFHLRDDLIEELRVKPPFPWPPIVEEIGPIDPPIPDPGPNPAAFTARTLTLSAKNKPVIQATQTLSPAFAALKTQEQQIVQAMMYATSARQIRSYLIDLIPAIYTHLCDFHVLWGLFRKDCLCTVDVDALGRFSTLIAYDCTDQPDLYFWVEQFQDGSWVTVYKPSIGCGTHWNYDCGTQVDINIPNAVGCQEPDYDLPAGVTHFVLPYSIGYAPIWGIPSGAPAAPNGWVRPDGFINYLHNVNSLGWIYDAPFGGTLHFYQDDSFFIPSGDIKYYRYSYRRAGEEEWTPINTSLGRGYRMEYSDRLPTYESYPVGPVTVGTQSNLFEFKPLVPPNRPDDPDTVVAREWTGGNVNEIAACWNTAATAPPLSSTNATDDAGDFEVKIEVFSPTGEQVLPGDDTFRFLVRNQDLETTRLATGDEVVDGGYVMQVHIDNNYAVADLPQPDIGGDPADPNCGFLRYGAGETVHLQYKAAHTNDHAVFRFIVKRGSNTLYPASTQAPYVETEASSALTSTGSYTKTSGYYQKDFTPGDLVDTCVNAAFAAYLYVYGKATNGKWRLGHNLAGYDTSRLIAFALAEEI